MTCQICNDSGQLGRDPDGEIVYCTCTEGLRANIEHCDELIVAYARALRESDDEDIRLACYIVQDERNYCMDLLIKKLYGFLREFAPAEAEAIPV